MFKKLLKNYSRQIGGYRMNRFCAERRVVGVPVVVEPVVVPVPLTTVPVEITDIQLVIGVAICTKYLLDHHLLNSLKVVFYLAS